MVLLSGWIRARLWRWGDFLSNRNTKPVYVGEWRSTFREADWEGKGIWQEDHSPLYGLNLSHSISPEIVWHLEAAYHDDSAQLYPFLRIPEGLGVPAVYGFRRSPTPRKMLDGVVGIQWFLQGSATLFGEYYRNSGGYTTEDARSEEHTSELQSQFHLVCRLLLEKK